MKPSTLIGLAIAGVGGYFVLKYLGYIPSTTTTTTTAPPTSTTPQANDQQTTSGGTTLQLIMAKLTADKQDPNSYQSADFWNYYYKLVRGIDAPDPAVMFPNQARDYKMSLSEWWAAMTGQGMSGLGCPTLCNAHWGGLSAIAPVMQMTRPMFRANVVANLSELLPKRVS